MIFLTYRWIESQTMLYNKTMGWWLGEEEKQEESTIPYSKCTECGDYKEVSKKYINKTTEEMVTICYDCGKQRYIESLMVVSAIDGFDDL